MQSKSSKSRLLWPALGAAALAVAGVSTHVYAEGSSSPAEVQRGVPGVDVDVNKDRSKGADVDIQAGNKNDSDNGALTRDSDTRKLGAGSDTGTSDSGSATMRKPMQDRN